MTDTDTMLVDEPSAERAPETPADRSAHVWVPAARPPVVTALEAAGLRLTDDPTAAQRAVVSTRLPRHRVGEFISLAHGHQLSVAVLVHPGGEALAVEALRVGGEVAIAEGDVDALRAMSGAEANPLRRQDSLLEAYESRLGRRHTTASRPAGAMVSPISGLPGSGALAVKMATTAPAPGSETRIMSIGVPGLRDQASVRLSVEAHALLHRRIAIAFRAVCHPHGDLYDLGEGSFLLLAQRLPVHEAERTARHLIEIVEAYVPDAHAPLTVAIGHAGPECSNDLATLRELAGRAESAAAIDERSAVLGAGELVGPLATATELEVTLRLADLADARCDGPSRDEVAKVASDLAARLGFEGREQLLVRFCARVAHIGAVLGGAPGAPGADSAARLLTATAGGNVAAAVRAIGEHWDGTGKPDGLRGSEIPAPARIAMVAEALVRNDFAVAELEAGSGTVFDPTVVAAALDLVGTR